MSRTDRNPRRRLDPATRQSDILTAAADAFASEPYEQVSMAEVARQAQASEALLYRYFGSKPALYAEVLRTSLQAIENRRRAAVAALVPKPSARGQLTTAVEVYLDALAERTPAWATAILTGSNDPAEALPVRAEIRDQRLAALRAIAAQQSVSEYALQGFLGFVDAACRVWIERGCPEADRAEVAGAAVNALLGPADEGRSEASRHGKFGRR